MGSFREAVDAIEIEQRSPKGIATVRVVRQNETRVTLSPSARTSFDDVTIAEDIEEALREAWSAAKDAYDELAAQYMRELPVPVDDDEATDAVRELRGKIRECEFTGYSERKWVEVSLDADLDPFIEFSRNVITSTNVSTSVLEMEIVDAIRKARKGIMREVLGVYRKTISI